MKRLMPVFVVVAAAAAVALSPVNQNSRGVAIKGYDPVAYFEAGKPTPGSDEFTTRWNGATWKFSSKKNLDLFVSEPEAYAPQYGGYCAKAVSEGHTADVDPEAWDIVDGRLYLNYSLKVRDLWRKDIPGRIQRADENWPKLIGK